MDMAFEWDEQKRQANIEKHGIDSYRAKQIWGGEVLEIPSPRSERRERRFITYGLLEDVVIAVVYTWRSRKSGRKRRLISARRARKHEEANYQSAFGRRS